MSVSKDTCKSLTDQEVVEKTLADVNFFYCIYDKYEQQLLRYICRLTRAGRAEAEDILQNAFIKIWKNLRAYNTDLKLSSWIYRIVHNETISAWRRLKSYGKDNTIDIEAGILANLSDDLDDSSSIEERNQVVREVLDELPLKYRSVLVLKFLEDLSYQEISDVLKIPEGTVATRINRAKKAFRKAVSSKHLTISKEV